MFSKVESIIPLLYVILFIRHTKLIQRSKHLRLRKAKAFCIHVGCCRYYTKVIQIGKNWFLGHSGNSCHNGSFQIRICLKCRIKQTSDKGSIFIPISLQICFLHWCIIFIQKNDDILTIIAVHPGSHVSNCFLCSCIVHLFRRSII